MAKSMYYVVALLMAVIAVSEARKGSGCGGMRLRVDKCRTSFGLFKRLLEDVEKEEAAGDEDERDTLPVGDPEADLRALLYGEDPEDSPAAANKRTDDTANEEDVSYEKRRLEIRKYELEMDLVEALLRDLENFDLEQ